MARGSTVVDKRDKPIDIADPFARKLVGKYLENRKDDITKLNGALLSGDFETIRVTGHNLYGSGAAYGLDPISEIGAAIEIAAREADSKRLKRLIEELRQFPVRMRVY